MANVTTTFQRKEKKYCLDSRQYQMLRTRLGSRVVEDQYGEHTIASLYFDTEDYQMIRHSIEKPVYKEKLRLRSYGVPGPEDMVYVELKKKCGGIVFKRRAPIQAADVPMLLREPEVLGESGQISRELRWALGRYEAAPKVLIAYDRIAMLAPEIEGLRITFDWNIRWRTTALDLTAGDWGTPLVGGEDLVLMEVKTMGAMPLWLSRPLAELSIYPTSFSKYGTCYRSEILPQLQKGVACCA